MKLASTCNALTILLSLSLASAQLAAATPPTAPKPAARNKTFEKYYLAKNVLKDAKLAEVFKSRHDKMANATGKPLVDKLEADLTKERGEDQAFNEDLAKTYAADIQAVRYQEQMKSDPTLALWTYFKFIDPAKNQGIVDALEARYAKEVLESKADKEETKRNLSEIEPIVAIALAAKDDAPDFKAEILELTNELHDLVPRMESRVGRFFKRVFALPAVLKRLHKVVKDTYNPKLMDPFLFAMYGFGNQVGVADKAEGKRGGKLSPYQQRPWPRLSLKDITTKQVIDMLPFEMADLAKTAGEIEAPIAEYSPESGRGFMVIMPTLARFMGKTPHELMAQVKSMQAEYTDTAQFHETIEALKRMASSDTVAFDTKGFIDAVVNWCESAWCQEERRHAGIFAVITEKMVGVKPRYDNPNEVTARVWDEKETLGHFYERYSTEWNASSIYAVMAAHAKDDLQLALMQNMTDEVKHLTIIGGSERYLLGPTTPILKEMLKVTAKYAKHHKNNRSAAKNSNISVITKLEILFAHVFSHYYTQKYMGSLPAELLAAIYEPTTLAPFPSMELPGEAEQELQNAIQDGNAKRLQLSRWAPKARALALAEISFSDANGPALQALSDRLFGSYKGAEELESERSKELFTTFRKIRAADVQTEFPNINKADLKILKRVLFAKLRRYQVFNNLFELNRQAEFTKAQTATTAEAPATAAATD